MTDDDTPTNYAPTELGGVIEETEAHTAWSLDDGDEWEPPRRLTSTGITALAVAGSLVLVLVAAAVYVAHSRPTLGTVAATTPSYTAEEPELIPVGDNGFDIPPPPPPPTVTVTQPPPAPVVMPQRSGGYTAEDVAPYDAQLVATLRSQGWAIWDPAQTALRAHQVCALLESGESMAQVKSRLAVESGLEPMMAAQTADQFAYAVTTIYPNCP